MASTGFFENTDTMPPRLPFAVVPALAVVALLFAFRRTRCWMDSRDAGILTAMRSVGIPVEIKLATLYLQDLVPREIMYHGHNFDVVLGITPPVIAWFGYRRKILPKALLTGWNVVCPALLCIVVTTAIGAVLSPMKAWCFDRPNFGVLRFPVTFLPGVIVPVVLLAHLVCLRQLVAKKRPVPSSAIQR